MASKVRTYKNLNGEEYINVSDLISHLRGEALDAVEEGDIRIAEYIKTLIKSLENLNK